MKIFLTGYMGSGKSVVGEKLAKNLNYKYVDLDDQIEVIQGKSINDIFEDRGELYFRKLESQILDDILENNSDMVISLGGGTPCYGDNFDRICAQKDAKSIYLKASIPTLTERLFQEKVHRPVISHLDSREALEEFIRKHLFERAYYYSQSDITVNVDEKEPEFIVDQIIEKL
ncbi:shikimate kinase [Salegentibacter sp. BDJ18]|jgi:shikimate kinase|uniref:shikimate kinase n=1 Tax=Salegentibacter sp. BDJ18 TaxID=2816376 RepID=UPI001AAE510A|nr:shikimate kinase [Salegentibacter sp. BDJ18]MBO2545934.1 shikimate kinase [Salegentibacter sp. BDJ18]